jgi:phospholipid transport system substrate-binding protein
MAGIVKADHRRVSRRALILGAGTAGLLGLQAGDAFAEHPSLIYMKKVAEDLLHAHRQGTVSSFLRAIQRHADVSGIALYSLGQYQSKLPSGQRQTYFRGVASFMARYFADQSRVYEIAKYELGEARQDGDKDVLITSKVYLMSGQIYTVGWRLSWVGGRYKVTDAKVLGFSLVYLQRGIFTSFLSKRNGDIAQLVAALNS